jgi:molecular chaperone GrpE
MLDRQALANQLLEYLDRVPELPDYLAAAPESLEPFDPYRLVGEWIALRQEVKQQNKLMQAQMAASTVTSTVTSTATTAPKTTEDGGLLTDLLSVMDALDQAIAHSQAQITATHAAAKPRNFWAEIFLARPPATDQSSLTASLSSNQAGIAMIRRSLLDLLQKRQIKPMNALGEPFDPQCMYAIAQQISDTAPANTVIQEVVRGYWRGDRILREAQVIVASQPSGL